jgi:uncharacterized protein YndB with AHSA1/START domain
MGMKVLKWGLAGIVVLLVVSFLLPSTTRVERSVTIDASPIQVFVYLNDYRHFNQWSPWYERDPNTQFEFSGPATGVGSRMQWQSDHRQVGAGAQEIVESEPARYLKVRLEFGDGAPAYADFRLTPLEAGTQVVWGFQMSHGWNPVSRWFGLMMDRWIGPDYQAGLANLKQVVETDRQSLP